ncbi:hypothetical protein [Pseudomonas vanderleydeniana]|uniref:Type III secretion protein n=1 Tax=Pseudomonas vanderleydeniana TaxID=2745495 RepID=A0A9E6PQK6_9PSED|nr:hypothetical protein [Pseudomonas vanderleydeniana]QXI31252.1 hypothetical protein HU752_015540 [Pseudomonas vanderleydeniana]
MKSWQAAVAVLSVLLLSACTSMSETSCNNVGGCQQVDANNSQLNVWWSPALRDGGGQYSTVSLND